MKELLLNPKQVGISSMNKIIYFIKYCWTHHTFTLERAYNNMVPNNVE